MTDLTENVGAGGASYGAKFAHFEKLIDCSAVNLAAAAHELFDVPAGMVHLVTVVEVLTAEGATATADIGITGGNVDVLIDGADLEVAGEYISGDNISTELHAMNGATAGHYTEADTTFSLLANDALDTAVFRVKSIWIDCRNILKDPA